MSGRRGQRVLVGLRGRHVTACARRAPRPTCPSRGSRLRRAHSELRPRHRQPREAVPPSRAARRVVRAPQARPAGSGVHPTVRRARPDDRSTRPCPVRPRRGRRPPSRLWRGGSPPLAAGAAGAAGAAQRLRRPQGAALASDSTVATRPPGPRMTERPHSRLGGPGRPRGAPSPGTPGTRGTPRRGSTRPDAQARAARASARQNSGAGGRAPLSGRLDRRQRRQTGTPERRRGLAVLDRSLRRMIPGRAVAPFPRHRGATRPHVCGSWTAGRVAITLPTLMHADPPHDSGRKPAEREPAGARAACRRRPGSGWRHRTRPGRRASSGVDPRLLGRTWVPILALTGHLDDRLVAALMDAGADDVIAADATDRALPDALRVDPGHHAAFVREQAPHAHPNRV